MSVFVIRDGKLVPKEAAAPLGVPHWHYMPDTPGYASPIDGSWVEGRAARREDLKRNGCEEAGDSRPRACRNEKFARKHGLRWIGDQ